jgi:hypothetical protein
MTDNLNLGRPLNHQQGSGASALNASAVPGDLNSSRDTEFAQDVLNSLNGDRQGQQQHSTSGQYSTTNPQSGLQKAFTLDRTLTLTSPTSPTRSPQARLASSDRRTMPDDRRDS